jgi:hypothetical protein
MTDDSSAGDHFVTQPIPARQEIMTYRMYSSLRIPSFVANCERSLRRLEAVRSAKQDRTPMRTAARVDSNQSAIVKALRGVGAFVQPLHTIGDGCPDLLVAYRGKWAVLEIKDGAKPKSQRKLTDDEEAWHAKASRCAPVFIAESIEDAMVVIGAVTVRE